MNTLLLLPLCFMAVLLSSCSLNTPEPRITFHHQTQPGESQNMIFTYQHKGKPLYMRKMPAFATSNFESYKPFPADNGKGYGAVFYLNDQYKKRLFFETSQHQGQYLVSIVNGTVGEAQMIDQPIKDGKLIIWDGITEKDLILIDSKIPRKDDTDEEAAKRAKEAKKAAKKIAQFEFE